MDIRQTPMEIHEAKELLIEEIRVLRANWEMIRAEVEYLNAWAQRLCSLEDSQKIDHPKLAELNNDLLDLHNKLDRELRNMDAISESNRREVLVRITKSRKSIPYLWILGLINLGLVIYLIYKG